MAASLPVDGKPTSLVFEYDAGSLWGFKLGDDTPVYDHAAGHLAYGLDREDRALCDGFRSEMAKLTGGRDGWALRPREQAVLDVVAADLPKCLVVSGRRVRHQLLKSLTIHGEEATVVKKLRMP